MLFDGPARILYRHGRNLYAPMRMLATPYVNILHVAIAIIVLLVVGRLLWDGGLMTALGIVHDARP
jgi:hypothetical protein